METTWRLRHVAAVTDLLGRNRPCRKAMQVQKCIEQMPPESVSFVVEAVEARSLGTASAARQVAFCGGPGQGRGYGGTHLRVQNHPALAGVRDPEPRSDKSNQLGDSKALHTKAPGKDVAADPPQMLS